jgi:hypothetical protein
MTIARDPLDDRVVLVGRLSHRPLPQHATTTAVPETRQLLAPVL